MAENNLVSIITPFFNSFDYFVDCFNSVIKQTYSNWEWIIVDDCSKEDQFEKLKELVCNEPRIKVFRNEENLGPCKTRNVALKAIKGRFICFLDSDDFWDEKKLECQVNFMLDNNYPFTFGNYYVLNTKGNISKYHPRKDEIKFKDLLKNNYMGCLTVMYDKDVIGEVYMPEDAFKREDYATWLDILSKGFTAKKLDVYLGMYRLVKNSFSGHKFSMIKYQYRVFRIHLKMGRFKSLFYVCCHIVNKIFRKY